MTDANNELEIITYRYEKVSLYAKVKHTYPL
jgi:hypothetical protein